MEHSSNSMPVVCERDASCPEHGAYISRNILRSVWSRCPACEAESARQQQAEKEEEAAKFLRAERAKMLCRAAIPERFIGRSFDNFKAETDPQRQAVTVARAYAEDFDKNAARGSGLIFSGQPGTGKSHLAAAILQYLFPRDVMYVTCMDVIRMVRETWRRDSAQSERQVLSTLGALDLLVIDEIGVQYGTEGEQTILFDVLDMRYRGMQPTVLLTNQNADGLRTYLGDRSYDRLRETSRMVQFEWESYRPTARKEGAKA